VGGEFGKNHNLQQLCGREVGKATYEELADEFVFTIVTACERKLTAWNDWAWAS